MKTVSRNQPLKHYVWGAGCDGWNFVDTPELSVKQERMPAGTAEEVHYHQFAQQFFFILKGTASFEINEERIELQEGEGIHIEAGWKHRIANRTSQDLEFLLSSSPATIHDRINVSQ
ncbi:MAG TPA: cupin domain-containing protein [Flavisolibacter sp.]|jgi:mannose-6-phosphate isomerase-like protein (cupin superfamily)|nr:cupin domain-containing protein [Flavisolibacter sp.]